MNAPLDGVTVLDLTRFLAGPMAGRVLADLGADVIKIEPPVGDPTRHVKPDVDGVSAYYAQTNTGKRNISIDITTSDGADLVARLAEQADVLLENYRPGVLDRHGLDASTLRSRAPRLVYCSISGYGQDGPWAGRRAFAPLVHAEAGTLEFAARKRQAGVLPEVQSHGDVYPAMTAAMSILAALVQRDRTGRGQRIDISMAEVLVYLNEWSAVDVAGFDDEQLFGAWTGLIGELANGRRVAFAGNPVWTFPLWLKAMARPELANDPRFATTDDRLAHQEELRELLRGFVATFHDADALEEHLEPFGIPVGSVRSLRDLATTPWAIEREIFTTVGPGVRVPNRLARWTDADVGPDRGLRRSAKTTKPCWRTCSAWTPAPLASSPTSGYCIVRPRRRGVDEQFSDDMTDHHHRSIKSSASSRLRSSRRIRPSVPGKKETTRPSRSR